MACLRVCNIFKFINNMRMPLDAPFYAPGNIIRPLNKKIPYVRMAYLFRLAVPVSALECATCLWRFQQRLA